MATAKNTQTNAAATIEHGAAITKYANAKGIDTVTAGKQYRATLRRNFEIVSTNDPKMYGKSGKLKTHANDKRPWGPMKRSTLQELFPNVKF